MSPLKKLLVVLIVVGCIGSIIMLSIVLTQKRYDCYLGSDEIPITGITFKQVDKHVLVTWNRPYQLNTCDQGYEVTSNLFKGKVTNITEIESITIPDSEICFEFDIMIKPITASSDLSFGKATYHDPRKFDVKFSIPRHKSSQVVVKWTHPNQEWCSLSYIVQYQTRSNKMAVNVTVPEANFDFVYCTSASLTIRGINPKDGSLLSPQTATFDATQYPNKIGHVRDMVTRTKDNEIDISWNPTKPIGTCSFTYRVVFTTDRGRFTLLTQVPHIVFSRDFYCFDVKTVIQAVVGKSATDISNTGITYGIAAVQDLKLSVSKPNSTVKATWSHLLDGRCGVNYEVELQRGDKIDTLKTSASNITFDLFYCVNTTVYVKALRPVGHPSEKANATHSEEYPTSLEPVRRVSFNKTETSTILSWETSTSVASCENLYSVTAKNDKTFEESTCQGTTGCEISLTDFCPQTTFKIKPASNLEGEEVIETLSC